MKRAVLLAVLVLGLAAPASAGATEVRVLGAADRPYQEWVDGAQVPTPPGRVTVIEQPCGTPVYEDGTVAEGQPNIAGESAGREACALPAGTIYLDLLRLGGGRIRWVFLHELGHVYDLRRMNDWARAAIAKIGHQPPWTRTTIGAPSSEFFAATFARCALPPLRPKRWVRAESWTLPRIRFRRICRVIWLTG